MQLVMNPEIFDIMLTPNLYGTIVINVATSLVGGPGVIPGTNFGSDKAIFEPGARHVGLDLEGKNIANPVGLLLSAVEMLKYCGLHDHAQVIYEAIHSTLSQKKILTFDVGGDATTKQFTQGVIDSLDQR